MATDALQTLTRKTRTTNQLARHGKWYDEARFGLFVHWGLYSLLGRGEWVMHQEKIAPEKYNRLASRFDISRFDADELANCAVRCGAKYIVLTARHHDGFCLWDTKTTQFNSVNSAAKRDIVAEYVAACRRAGLRVGIYYSIMSWQHESLHKGPLADPHGWELMVQESHAQLREIMTRYGKIDLLWYDGGFVPGLGDGLTIAKYWRSKALNAMIRKHQPAILINDRSGTAENFTTPEQHIVPSPPGRRWEACMTLNDHWGYCKTDQNYKSLATVVNYLITCARFGGNLLLNIGPRGDGSIPKAVSKHLDAIGAWMKINGQSIYGSERTAISEANLGALTATTRDKKLYLHPRTSRGEPIRIGIAANTIQSYRATDGSDVQLIALTDNTFSIQSKTSNTIEIECKSPVSRIIPARVLGDIGSNANDGNVGIVFGAGKYDPEPAKVIQIQSDLVVDKKKIEMTILIPAAGRYDLSIGVVGRSPELLSVNLGGKRSRARITFADLPDTLDFKNIVLPKGELKISLDSKKGPLTIYGIRLQPKWQPIDSTKWQTIGPFYTGFGMYKPVSEVRKAMLRIDPPQLEDKQQAMQDALGRDITWQEVQKCVGEHSHEGVNFPYRVARDYIGVCYARTEIVSPDDRDVLMEVGVDWWASAWINGNLIESDRLQSQVAEDAAQFNAWRPRQAKFRMKKGRNTLLIKCHPGTAACWFTCWVTDPGDLRIGTKVDQK